MTHLTFDAASGAYFAFDPPAASHQQLTELRWQPHPSGARAWYVRSPYLAAPFWKWVRPGDTATIGALGPFAWNYMTSFADAPLQGTGVDEIRLPYGSRPYPFQIAGIQLCTMRRRILLADEQGNGKSLQALAVANLTRPKRILIGCPTFLVDNWSKECEKWLVDSYSITILGRGKRGVSDEGIMILPFSKGHNFVEKILAGPPVDLLIADQIEQLKSPTARRTVPWYGEKSLFAFARRVVATTGSPRPNHSLEMHGVLASLSPETMGQLSREAFKQEYCSTFTGRTNVKTKGGGEASVEFEKVTSRNEGVLNAELRASGLMVRRLKEDVLKQLPAKNTYLVHLTPTTEIANLVREEVDLYTMLESRVLSAQDLIAVKGHIAHVRAKLGLLKAPKIFEYVRWLFEQGESRVVVFMLHLEAIEKLRELFAQTQIVPRLLTGSQSPRQRQDHVDAFQRPGGYEVNLCQMKAAGVGLTMTAARFCVLGELSWVPTDNEEAGSRIHRISQTRQVEIVVPTFPYAIEEKVLTSTAEKAFSGRKVLDINLQNIVSTF